MQISTRDSAADIQVQRIAKEYEDYAYIVSHDLGAPLRHIREFTKLLLASRQESLTKEEQDYAAFIEKSLEKINNMQTALLAFSRLNTRAGSSRQIDVNHIFSNVLQEQEENIKKYTAAINCGSLPMVVAEPQQLHFLFSYLIDNALKFHENETSPREISISAKEEGQAWLFEIKDNGIGIAEDYHEEVFRLFRRLNPEKYPGIGAGLTLARKIVQLHGGEIHIKSSLGAGTSIYFTLPKHGEEI